ncbi:MAG TPA: TerB family tellurite resistance protein [Gammaproteobacteria bacterium]|nr:TerB family tellurite resistance protein [Gammaproteobacteria bacterium]
MMKAIREFFDAHLRPESDEAAQIGRERTLELATAALLIEITRADNEVKQEERDAVTHAIQRLFAELSQEETAELIRLAEQQASEATSLFQFTNLVDKNFSREEKIHIVEMLWRVVYADDDKDMNEEYLVRKIADLLHVSHKDFIRTRYIVEDDLKGARS